MKRRDFLTASGALVVSFAWSRAVDVEAAAAAQLPAGFNGTGSNQLDAWISVGSDGLVTARTGKCELGHGLFTAQTQLVAEELSVPFERVKLIQCDTGVTPDQGTTSGAQSHPTNFNHANLALAAATAREALVRLASERLGVPVDQLTAENGAVRVRADASRMVTYAQLVGGRTFNLMLDPNARRKDPNAWTVLGKPIHRVEFPAMVTGQFEYVHNVRVPGMLHGRVVRPPTRGATLVRADESSVSGMPGVVKVVVKKNFVGVVAERPWQAVQAAARLKATWAPGPALPAFATFHDTLRQSRATRDALVVNSGDTAQKFAGAAKTVKAAYRYPFQMHGSMGTACAVADVQGGKATVWSATQAVYPLRSSLAMLLGLNQNDVHVTFRLASGCYGINGADAVSYDAALMSQAVGRPVRVQLMRRDEMAWENYGFSYVIEERAALDARGGIVAWDHESWDATLGGRPGTNAPGNVVTGMLAGFEPAGVTPRTPAPEPTRFANNANAAPSYVRGAVGGRAEGTGAVASERVLTHDIQSPFLTGPLRSPSRLQNTFAHESFIDEIAASVGADPVEYRLRHITDSRLVDVVKAAAKAAAWDARPSPQRAARRTGVASGRGMSCVLYEGDNGYCAMVAEVDVDQDSGRVTVKRFVIAEDCGPISNPDGLRNQLEGGALQGMSRALLEEVTWDAEKVTSIDWKTYRPLYLGAEVPKIETVLINPPNEEATGAGETSVTVTAAAIANAIFDATGARVREAPFTPERVKAALAARA